MSTTASEFEPVKHPDAKIYTKFPIDGFAEDLMVDMLSVIEQPLRELERDKERYVIQSIARLGLTFKEFTDEYLIEEYPMEFESLGAEFFTQDNRFRVVQKWNIRRKTDEEKAANA